MQNQRIAIVGAGTAGLATAIFLARNNQQVTLIEKAEALAPVGAGILLQPSGLAVLDQLDCREAMEEYGHRIEALYGLTRSDRKIMQVNYRHLPASKNHASTIDYGLGVHRAALCKVLDDKLQQLPHQRWFGCDVQHMESTRHAERINFIQAAEQHSETFDAVIVANGSASQLRPRHLVKYNRPYPWGAMWLIRPLTESLAAFNQPYLQQRYQSTHTMAGMLPTGCLPGAADTSLVSFFWSLPVATMPHWQQDNFDLDDWKHQVLQTWPALAPLLQTINNPGELVAATYRDVIMRRWGENRIGVIGDAAHAMSPQLGQGANMALLDAQALAQSVAHHEDWPSVWDDFYHTRKGSIRFYQSMSRLLTPLFQSRIPAIGFCRDIALPFSHHIPWLRQHMAATVAGTKTGWLR